MELQQTMLSNTQKVFSLGMVYQKWLFLTMILSSVQKCTLQQNTSSNTLQAAPYYLRSNGDAERAVGTIKSLLKMEEDPY